MDGVSGREETSKKKKLTLKREKTANQKPINKGKILGVIIAVVAVLMIAMAGALWEDADKSKNYVCQMPVTGNYVVWTDGGLQWQGLGTVRSYSKTSQIEFTGLEKNEDGYVAAGSNPAAALANSKVQWVPSVMFGGNGSGNNAMDAVGLKMLMDITKSFDKK